MAAGVAVGGNIAIVMSWAKLSDVPWCPPPFQWLRRKGAPCRTGTHTGRYPHTRARGHVEYARVYTQTLTRRPFADFETLVLMIFARFRAIRKLNYPS